jgi:G3E family GTPase
MAQTPVSIVTGFLGSGKTTLLNRALGDARLARTAVLINEFGEIGLDHDLVQSGSDNVVLLENGCLCCAVKGDLVKALDSLARGALKGELPSFDRCIIETSGLAEPTPVIEVLLSEPTIAARYALHDVTTTLDAINGAATLAEHLESAKQVALADRVLITKTDLLPDGPARDAALDALRARIAALNPAAPVVDAATIEHPAELMTAPNDDATPLRTVERVAAALALRGRGVLAGSDGSDTGEDDDAMRDEGARYASLHAGRGAGERIRTFGFMRDEPLPMRAVEMFLDALAQSLGPALLRVKGLIHVREHPEGPAVVHGAQQLLHGLAWMNEWPSDDRRTRIVFITLAAAVDEVAELYEWVRRMAR